MPKFLRALDARGLAIAAALMLSSALTPAAQAQFTFQEYPLAAGSTPFGITLGPDGALWFTQQGNNRIGRITQAGVITSFLITTASSGPQGITSGPDGNLWFTENTANKIGKITTAGVVTEFPLPTVGSGPAGITLGPDGNLWFTQQTGNRIGRITTAGAIIQIVVPTLSSQPEGITSGPDGALWFTEMQGNKIGRITTAGTITNEFPLPAGITRPHRIVTGPDGNLWITAAGADRILRMTTAGVFTPFTIPTPFNEPIGITAGFDGALWFTEWGERKIGRITTTGTITEQLLPNMGSQPQEITQGPDGALWFTELNGNRIGTIRPSCTDAFAGATALWGTRGSITATNVGATGEAGEPNHAGNSTPLNSLWCKWTAPSPGAVTFDTTGSRIDTTLGVYTGAAVNALTAVVSNDNAPAPHARVTFSAVAGTTYFIAIDGAAGATGEMLLTWNQNPSTSPLLSAVLPYARSGLLNAPVTAFGAMINTGGGVASSCAPALPPGFPASFLYQTTSPANVLVGSPSTPVNIAAGATQNFVFGLTPSLQINAAEIPVIFACTSATATSTVGLNSFITSAGTAATPDMVAIGVTPSNDGIVDIPGNTGTGLFAAAVVNIGAAGAITATADDGGRSLPVVLTLCETNASGVCINPATPSTSVSFTSALNQISTFTILALGTGNVPFDPANNRLFLRFKTADGITRGATNVAVRTSVPDAAVAQQAASR